MEQRVLWDKAVADYSVKLKAEGVEFIDIDTKPFFDATAPVRAKFGAKLSLETLGQPIAELPWLPVGVTYAALPLGSLITLLFVIERRCYGAQEQRPLVRYEAQGAVAPAPAEGRA